MKNSFYKRLSLTLTIIVACSLVFGLGWAIGASTTASFLIDKAVQLMTYEGISIDISRVELMEYYIKLKGGM